MHVLKSQYHIVNIILKHLEHNVISLFTDGSVCIGLVRAAFVLMKLNGSIIKIGNCCMPRHATIFNAEVVALMRGIEYLLARDDQRDYDVFTDGLSALQAPSNTIKLDRSILKLEQDINHLNQKCKVNLYFVKGHTGILGNELEDRFASDARRQGAYTPIEKSKKYVKKAHKKARNVCNVSWFMNRENKKKIINGYHQF